MRRTTILSLLSASVIFGIALARFQISTGGWVVLAAALVCVIGWNSRFRLAGLIFLAVMFGLWRASIVHQEELSLLGLMGDKVTLQANVADDVTTDPKGFITFTLDNLKLEGRPLAGHIRTRLYSFNLHRGYLVEVTGKLRPGFGNEVVELGYPQLTVLSTHQGALEKIRQKFFVGMHTALPEPISSFALGLLVGVRALIPKPLQNTLALVGLSHLVAVSGYNLTIIVRAAQRGLARFGNGVALVTILWLIGMFLLVTGATASVVRASLVCVLALLASQYGRQFHPMVLILLSAAGTALWHPRYLTDIGWLLSFLAFYGIMVMAPAVEARLGHPKAIVVKLLIESLAAQILTLPLILYFFGQLSLVAPISNLVILPLVPLAMLVAFVAGLAGMLMPPFAGWLAWPAQWVMGFMLDLVNWFASWPWAGQTMHISFGVMLGMYAVILIFTYAIGRVSKPLVPGAASKLVLVPR